MRSGGDRDLASLCKELGFYGESGSTEGRILSRGVLPSGVDGGKVSSTCDFS